MQPYATDSEERKTTIIGIFIFAILVSPVVQAILKDNGIQISPPLESPSALFIFGILYWLFDNLVWKWPIMRSVGLVKIPNLNGTWQGILKSSYDDFKTEHTIKLVIRQTWLRINIELQANRSHSSSTMAGIFVNNHSNPDLSYEYQNNPDPHAIQSMNIHRGTTHLSYQNKLGISYLEGEYYTGRGRQTIGTISVKRIQ